MWFAGLAVIAAIAATYYLTRPPALVWWTSPPIGNSGRHVLALIPNGWKHNAPEGGFRQHGDYRWFFGPVGHTPLWLRWILRRQDEQARLVVYIGEDRRLYGSHLRLSLGAIEVFQNRIRNENQAMRWIESPDSKLTAVMILHRTDERAFARTYPAVCNSLRIE